MGTKQRKIDAEQIVEKWKTRATHNTVILAIPSHDKKNMELGSPKQRMWAEQASSLFGRLFGGSTVFETFRGVFLTDKGEELTDAPMLVESYDLNSGVGDTAKVKQILDFCRRMKADTNQDSVLLVVNDWVHLI